MPHSGIGAEAKINQIMQRIDNIEATKIGSRPQEQVQQSPQSKESFQAIAALMQAQMLSQGLSTDNKDGGGGLFGGSNNMMTSNLIGMMMQQQGLGPNGQAMPNMGVWSSLPNQVSQSQNLSAHSRHNHDVRTATKAEFPVNSHDSSISSHFGHRHLEGHHGFHEGVDIAAPLGAPIKAPWSGEVVYVGHADGFGDKTVIIAHPETKQADGRIVYSIFGHNQDVNVRTGDKVTKGQEFATVGQDGHATGPHLHWETRLAEPGLAGKNIFSQHLSFALDPLSFA